MSAKPADSADPIAVENGNPVRSDDIERIVLGIWQDVFQQPIDGFQSFFDLGGDSIYAVRILGRVREELGVHLTVIDLFDRPTVTEFSEVVRVSMAR